MLPSGVMGGLPLRINDWPFSYLDYAVAWHEADFTRSIYEVDVRPLIAMMMHIVRQLAEQDALCFQNPIGLFHKRWERVRKGVVVFLGRAQHQPEPCAEVLLVVFALIRDMRRVIHHHIKIPIPKGHLGIVSYDHGTMARVDIQPNYRALAIFPKATAIHGGIQDLAWFPARVKVQHPSEKFGVFAEPNGGQRRILGNFVRFGFRPDRTWKRLKSCCHRELLVHSA